MAPAHMRLEVAPVQALRKYEKQRMRKSQACGYVIDYRSRFVVRIIGIFLAGSKIKDAL
jgi:hypothetical protein